MMRKKEIMHELDKAIEVIVNDKIVWDGPMADFIVENQYDIEESDIKDIVQLDKGATLMSVSYTHLTLPTNREV